jgi:hypothetical protein
MFKRIKLAIAIVKTAASFVGDVKTALLVPFIVLVLIVVDIFLYGAGFIYVYA